MVETEGQEKGSTAILMREAQKEEANNQRKWVSRT
jgi:hypothetical protein